MEKPEEIQKKLESISETQKITKAMEMVASSKIRKAQNRITEARDFISIVEDVITDIACYSGFVSNPLLEIPDRDITVMIVGITSDTGLCGGYNSNIIRLIEKTIPNIARFSLGLLILATTELTTGISRDITIHIMARGAQSFNMLR